MRIENTGNISLNKRKYQRNKYFRYDICFFLLRTKKVDIFKAVKPEVMISQRDLKSIILSELPEVKNEIKYVGPLGDVNQTMRILSNYTKEAIRKQDWKAAFKCMELVDTVYLKGNLVIKNAVENVFVFPLGKLSETVGKSVMNFFENKMPTAICWLFSIQAKGNQ